MEAGTLNLFKALAGVIRELPEEIVLKYRKRYLQAYVSQKHEYDTDICTLYKQMDNWGNTYSHFLGKSYAECLRQISHSLFRLYADYLSLDRNNFALQSIMR